MATQDIDDAPAAAPAAGGHEDSFKDHMGSISLPNSLDKACESRFHHSEGGAAHAKH
jgi:hypothetical protein